MWFRYDSSLLLVIGLLLVQCTASPVTRQSPCNKTADSAILKTWWHNTGEINTQSPVENGNVRQSHVYSIQVASASSPRDFYDTSVHESMPRNGNGDICLPGDLNSICPPNQADDGITIEGDIGADMAWTQYLTSDDSILRITRNDGASLAAGDVLVRPTNLNFDIAVEGDAVLVHVPFSHRGHRFSVEFKDNLWVYRNSGPGNGDDIHYVQDVNPDGKSYVPSYKDSMPVVGVEPLNALLIFASTFASSEDIPDDESGTY